ncbi:sugar transferase [Edaphobacter paludis]|uniref:Sugar transferase n=1 Tax=Edaphobacter paludis TaxID=3035702 RepID=A0AAU7D4X9_9BACT
MNVNSIVREPTLWQWKENRSNLRGWIRRPLDRLRHTQFRSGSTYSKLRSFIPVLSVGAIWLWLIRGHFALGGDNVLNLSITLRHLLLTLSVITLWNLWMSFSPYTWHSAEKDLINEVTRLSVGSIICGLLPFIGNVSRAMYGQAIFLALLTASALMLTSLLLIGAFLAASCLFPRLSRSRAAILVGSGQRASELRERLQCHHSRLQVYGCVDDEDLWNGTGDCAYLGKIGDLAELLKKWPIEVVLIGLPVKSKYSQIQQVIDICETVGVESHYMRDIFATTRSRLQTYHQESHFAVLSSLRRGPKHIIKRTVDIVGALIILVLVSPIMLAAAIAVRMSSAGPIIFVQQRYGHHRKRFPMFKFRTMVADAEKRQAELEVRNEARGPVFKLKADPRITRVGAFLRRTSIDELPQLFNVLRGEMSLVGPRPLPLRDVSHFEEAWLLRRFSIRPGLTCIWQISGRSESSFDDWIKQDLTYIDTWSLALDLKILVMTVPAVLRGKGAM